MAHSEGKGAAGLHTGHVIRQALQSKRVTHAALARATHRPQSNIGRLVKEPSTQAYILWEMSQALGHNLFADLAAQLDAATNGRLQEGTVTVESLQKELQTLREERDVLMKVLAERVNKF